MKLQCHHNLHNLLDIACDHGLLGAVNRQDFDRIYQDKFNQFNQFFHSHIRYPQILLVEGDPVQFLASFMAAVAAKCPIFLGSQNWRASEWQQVFEQIQPDIILGHISFNPPKVERCHHQPLTDCIMIPTGGTSGIIKFAVHTWDSLMASVKGFQQYFQRSPIHSYCILPLYHVSGLMQFIRSFTSGGKLVFQSFKAVEAGDLIDINPSEFFISLVPTQLQRLLQNSKTRHWLSQFHTVLLGGAPAWPELLEQARHDQIRLAPTYGMTETASQIATLKPEEFLAGAHNSGRILPHAQIKICNAAGEVLGVNQVGLIQIEANSLMRGYYSPDFDPETRINQFHSDDLGYVDEQGYLTLVGRNSNKIITGGENVFPSEIEAVIRATGKVKEVCVIGLPDQDWGQIVTAVYVPFTPQVDTDFLKENLTEKLCRYKQPKLWIALDEIPHNSHGKVNRKVLTEVVNSLRLN